MENDPAPAKNDDSKWPKSKSLAQAIASYVGMARAAIEFCGRHPFVTGLLALLSIAGLILSIISYRLDRQDAQSTTDQVRRVEERIEHIARRGTLTPEAPAVMYRDCDDHQVYLAVMDSARNLPPPYSDWSLRGSSEIRTVRPGVCEMTVLFVHPDRRGMMEEVIVSYKTDVPVSSIRIQTVHPERDTCKDIVLTDDLVVTSISGEAQPQGYDCYYLSTQPNRTVRIALESRMGWLAATVVGVGDARGDFEFLTILPKYEIRVFHLMRSSTSDRYALLVSIK
jgi:hypothetical protein